MNWLDLSSELLKECPDVFENYHIKSSDYYEDIEGQLRKVYDDYDAIVFDFKGKYNNKYKVTVRVWSDFHVTATIEIKDRGYFEYPITSEDEHFDEIVNVSGPQILKNDPMVKSEVKEIYDWTFSAYSTIVK